MPKMTLGEIWGATERSAFDDLPMIEKMLIAHRRIVEINETMNLSGTWVIYNHAQMSGSVFKAICDLDEFYLRDKKASTRKMIKFARYCHETSLTDHQHELAKIEYAQ